MESFSFNPPMRRQFSLAALFEFVTLCSVLCAFSGVTGIAPIVFLMGMAAAIWSRFGAAALVALAGALTFTSADAGNATLSKQFAVLLLAAVICWWYCYRRHSAVNSHRAFYGPDTKQISERLSSSTTPEPCGSGPSRFG